jgi:hypothetical protein
LRCRELEIHPGRATATRLLPCHRRLCLHPRPRPAPMSSHHHRPHAAAPPPPFCSSPPEPARPADRRQSWSFCERGSPEGSVAVEPIVATSPDLLAAWSRIFNRDLPGSLLVPTSPVPPRHQLSSTPALHSCSARVGCFKWLGRPATSGGKHHYQRRAIVLRGIGGDLLILPASASRGEMACYRGRSPVLSSVV